MNRSGLTVTEVKQLLDEIKALTAIDIRYAPLHRKYPDEATNSWVKCQKCRKHITNAYNIGARVDTIYNMQHRICSCPHCGQLLLVG